MAFGFDQSSHDAVLFVDQNKVIKEMLLSEFDAVLDGVVGEVEFAGTRCNAVYLKIDRQLNIVGAVFFNIAFDKNGNADRRWNIPLAQMVETASFGSELNGVRIRVASRSQCQIPWHQQDLWEPDLSVGSNTLKMLAAAVKTNKLGLMADDKRADNTNHNAAGDEPPLLDKPIGDTPAIGLRKTGGSLQESVIDGPEDDDIECDAVLEDYVSREQERYKMAQNIKKQRAYIASLKALHEQELEAQRILFAKDRETFLHANKQLQTQAQDIEQRYCELLIKCEHKDTLVTARQQEHEQQLARVMDQNGIDHKVLRDQYRKEFQAKLIEQTSEIESQLEMREVEVYYREEQINRLKTEVERLKAQAERLQSQSLSSEINTLVDNGVHFVVTQPGLGPISIAAQDLLFFNAEPNRYMAERLGVELELYEAWLKHIKAPMCAGDIRTGADCSASIELVAKPQEFVVGVSDHCAAHQHGRFSVASGS